MPLPLPPQDLYEFEEDRAPHGAGIALALAASGLFWAFVVFFFLFHLRH